MRKSFSFLCILSLLLLSSNLRADLIWPYSLKFMVHNGETVVENEASMWIGDPSKPVRGLILTSMVRNEIEFNYDEKIRNTCKEKGLALVFFYKTRTGDYYDGGALSVFDKTKGHDTVLLKVLHDFSEMVNKPEIEHAPWLTFGHSTAGNFARNIAWWKPERMFGVIFYKTGGYDPPVWVEHPDTARFLNVPWLSVAARNDKFGPGENGWLIQRMQMMPWRERGSLMSQIVEPLEEEGHSLWRPFNGPYFAMWIKKAVDGKIPADTIAKEGTVPLKEISLSTGVLSDTLTEIVMDSARIRDNLLRYYYDVEPKDRGEMFWHFDDEMAITWVHYEHMHFDEFKPDRDTTIVAKLKFWKGEYPLGSGVSTAFDTVYVKGKNAKGITEQKTTAKPNQAGYFNLLSYSREIEAICDIKGSTEKPEEAVTMLPYINGMDLYYLNKIVNSISDFKPSVYQIWASDVNLDGKVDSIDYKQVIERSLLKIPEFDQEQTPSIDMFFYDSANIKFNKYARISKTYPEDDGIGFSKHRIPCISNIVIPQYEVGNPYPQYINTTFLGILPGDIDGSFGEQDYIIPESPSIIIDLDNKLLAGESVLIPLLAESEEGVYSADVLIKLQGSSNFGEIIPVQNVKTASNTREKNSYFVCWAEESIITDSVFADLVFQGSDFSEFDVAEVRGYINGKECPVKFLNTSSINDKHASIPNNNPVLYPVPASDVLNIVIPQDLGRKEAIIRIYDISGKESMVKNISGNKFSRINIPVNRLADGIYLLEISSGIKVYKSLFVIQR